VVEVAVAGLPLHLPVLVVDIQVDLVVVVGDNQARQVLVILQQHRYHKEMMVELDLLLTHQNPELVVVVVLVDPEVLLLDQQLVVMEVLGHHLPSLDHQ
jgi:hypothetical protein